MKKFVNYYVARFIGKSILWINTIRKIWLPKAIEGAKCIALCAVTIPLFMFLFIFA